MKKLTLELPDKMADYIKASENSIKDTTKFKRAAFFLYAYIDSGLISHEKAADLLGVNKFKLIDFYGGYGIPYIIDGDELDK